MTSRRSVVLFSGGLDSTICLVLAAGASDEVYPLLVNYDQKAFHDEYKTAKRILGLLSGEVPSESGVTSRASSMLLRSIIESMRQNVMFLDLCTVSMGLSAIADNFSLLGGSRHLGMSQEYAPCVDVAPDVLPFRNTMFLSAGMLYALNVDASSVYIGVSGDDGSFPDCRSQHVYQASELLYSEIRQTFSNAHVEVRVPLLNISRKSYTQEYPWVRDLLEYTLSCYFPVAGKPCGKCFSCREKTSLLPSCEHEHSRYQDLWHDYYGGPTDAT